MEKYLHHSIFISSVFCTICVTGLSAAVEDILVLPQKNLLWEL